MTGVEIDRSECSGGPRRWLGLENMIYKERLRNLGQFSVMKTRLGEDDLVISLFSTLSHEIAEARLFSEVHRSRMRDNEQVYNQNKSNWLFGKCFFSMKEVKCWSGYTESLGNYYL